jgi:uncharacterized protein YjbI with pentapeptide repeats
LVRIAWDFRGVNLSGADLRLDDLQEANLSGVNLSHSDLRDADLRGAAVLQEKS